MNENDVYVVVCCCIPTTWDFHTKTHFDWELSTHYNSVWVICFCFVSQSKDWWFKKLTYSKRTWNLAHGCILFKIDVFELRRRQQKRELFLRKKIDLVCMWNIPIKDKHCMKFEKFAFILNILCYVMYIFLLLSCSENLWKFLIKLATPQNVWESFFSAFSSMCMYVSVVKWWINIARTFVLILHKV